MFALSLAVTLVSAGCGDDGRYYTVPDSEPSDDTAKTVKVDTTQTPSAVRYKTFKGLVMAGYQGWFTNEFDWTTATSWVHLQNSTGGFKTGASCVDYWPDLSEYTKLYNTPLKMPDGSTAQMFSSADPETIDLHFKWMKQYGIDGAIVQRFKSAVENNPSSKQQIGYILDAAKKYGRAVMIEYDLSGLSAQSDEQEIIDDWNSLVEMYGLNDPSKQPTYVWTDNKPLVGFYGIDMSDRGGVPSQYINMFDKMIGRDGQAGGCSFLAGCSYNWRVEGNDAGKFADWKPVLERCSVIAPWAVGRYSSRSGFTSKYSQIIGDLDWCNERNIIYAPVAFPGFSWHNMHVTWSGNTATENSTAPYDACPRLKGDFFWTQLACYIQWGCPSVFIAMFDEMDEGTCIFKCSHKDQTPVMATVAYPNFKFLSYDDDLPTGYYLHLAGSAAKWIKGATGYTQKRPAYVEPTE